jgi:hypothetical protein
MWCPEWSRTNSPSPTPISRFNIHEAHYANVLSDPSPSSSPAYPARTGRVLTSLIAIACLRAQTGVGPQVLSHVFRLRKAFDDCTAENVEGGRWLASDEGSRWILEVVDGIVGEIVLPDFSQLVSAASSVTPQAQISAASVSNCRCSFSWLMVCTATILMWVTLTPALGCHSCSARSISFDGRSHRVCTQATSARPHAMLGTGEIDEDKAILEDTSGLKEGCHCGSQCQVYDRRGGVGFLLSLTPYLMVPSILSTLGLVHTAPHDNIDILNTRLLLILARSPPICSTRRPTVRAVLQPEACDSRSL